MATDNIPPPPLLGPIGPNPLETVAPGNLAYVVIVYDKTIGQWKWWDAAFAGWDSLPLGYYRTQANFTDLPMFVYVSSRRGLDGTWLPGLLNPLDSPLAQGADCPDGYGDVQVSELKLPPDPYNHINYWTETLGLTSLCAKLAPTTVLQPSCPPGTIWDPTTETCKAVIIPIIPVQPPAPPPSPPSPPPPTPPPGTQPQCPPFTMIPDCLPPPPVSDPNSDEVGDGFAQAAYWIQILAIYTMNLYQVVSTLQLGQGGQGGTQDPVTCSQLGSYVNQIRIGLQNIAGAISSAPGSSGTPIDLTPITEALAVIAAAIAARGEEPPVDLSVIEAELAGDPTLQAFIDALIADGVIDPALGQLI